MVYLDVGELVGLVSTHNMSSGILQLYDQVWPDLT